MNPRTRRSASTVKATSSMMVRKATVIATIITTEWISGLFQSITSLPIANFRLPIAARRRLLRVHRRYFPAQIGIHSNLIQRRDSESLRLGIAGRQQVKLRHLVSQRANLEELVAHPGCLADLLRRFIQFLNCSPDGFQLG